MDTNYAGLTGGPAGFQADPAGLRPYDAVKRAIDLFGALAGLVVLSPLMAACAVAIRLDSQGSVLFRQERVGQWGRRFTMLKFRSMYPDVDPHPHIEYVTAFIRGEAPRFDSGEGLVYKLVADKRVTRVGRWLRRMSLDELPQLWNVLRGEMSLVGPRPPTPYEVSQYQPAHFGRLAVKPGITGLWQVCGRSTTTFQEMVAMDLEYIRRRSLWLDLKILLKTIPAVLSARGAH